VALVTAAIVWVIAKRKISIGLLFVFLFVISVAWKWVLLVCFNVLFYTFSHFSSNISIESYALKVRTVDGSIHLDL
jgi:hypothetical protein